MPGEHEVADPCGGGRDGVCDSRSRFRAPVHAFRFDTDECAVGRQIAAQPQRIEDIGQAEFVDAAVMISQVPVHLLALEDRHGAGWFAEPHGVQGDESVQVGEAVHQRKSDRSGVQAAHAGVRMMCLEMAQGMDARAVVLQEIVTDPDDRDRIHAEVPKKSLLEKANDCAALRLYWFVRTGPAEIEAMTFKTRLLALAFILYSTAAAHAEPVRQCPPADGVAVQVLGSGGPIADDARASTAYIVWIDGRSRVLVDAGGGTFLRFGEAGASFVDLGFVGLSHFHTDHSADFPALLKSGNFSGREAPLPVAGPGPGGPFPGLGAWLDSMLAAGSGAYGYLSGYLDGSGKLVKLLQREVANDTDEPVRVLDGDITVEALPVPHGIVPALGYRVAAGELSIVFASDQNGSSDAFVDFARDASLLVMHLPIPEGATGAATQLHARPSDVARVAREAGAGTLLLSHFMARSLDDLDANVDIVRDAYDGEVVVASDLACVAVAAQP